MGFSVGIVGLGAFGSEFAALFATHPLVEKVALCDLEPQRLQHFAAHPHLRPKLSHRDCHLSLDALLDSDLDAVALFTQPWLHAPQAIAALSRGKHVYSAVPLIWRPDYQEVLDWCDKLIAACRGSGRHYMLGETTFYHPQAMYCRRRAASGDFGRFVYAEGEYRHGFDDPQCDLRQVQAARCSGLAGRDWLARLQPYRQRNQRAGPMLYPTHSVSGPMSVMGAHAVKVCCWGQKPQTADPYFRDAGEVFANQTALFAMSNGATLRICEHRQCSFTRDTFSIYGTAGSFEQDCWRSYQSQHRPTIQQMRDPLPADVEQTWRQILGEGFWGGHGGSHAYLVHEFLAALHEDRAPAISAWDAVRYTAAGAAAHQSALRDGELTAVADWGPGDT